MASVLSMVPPAAAVILPAILLTNMLALIGIPLAGLIPFQASFIPAALAAALWAPILALAMAGFAKDKLQGFVPMRVTNALLVIALRAWFLDARWESLFPLMPAYWPLKTFWLAARGEGYLLFALGGVIYDAAVTAWLYRRFQRVLRRAG